MLRTTIQRDKGNKIKIKGKCHSLGLDLRYLMSRVRAGFFVYKRSDSKESKMKLESGLDIKKKIDHLLRLEDMKIDLPNGNVIALKEVATYSIKRRCQ